jgi:hypothetical protein
LIHFSFKLRDLARLNALGAGPVPNRRFLLASPKQCGRGYQGHFAFAAENMQAISSCRVFAL